LIAILRVSGDTADLLNLSVWQTTAVVVHFKTSHTVPSSKVIFKAVALVPKPEP
jgi:hypothetical protein